MNNEMRSTLNAMEKRTFLNEYFKKEFASIIDEQGFNNPKLVLEKFGKLQQEYQDVIVDGKDGDYPSLILYKESLKKS